MNSRLTNDGRTLKLELDSNLTTVPAKISGGGLNGTYHFAAMHFHWGENSKVGSEHSLNSETFPLEVNLLHYNIK